MILSDKIKLSSDITNYQRYIKQKLRINNKVVWISISVENYNTKFYGSIHTKL